MAVVCTGWPSSERLSGTEEPAAGKLHVMVYKRGRCPECAEGIFEGNGRCSHCDGTGINTQLDSAQSQCPYCKGTGVCAACGGTGAAGRGGPDDPNSIQKLFS